MSCTIHDVCLGDCANRDRPTCSHISRDLTGRCFACGHVDDAIRADQAAADARHREYAKTAPPTLPPEIEAAIADAGQALVDAWDSAQDGPPHRFVVFVDPEGDPEVAAGWMAMARMHAAAIAAAREAGRREVLEGAAGESDAEFQAECARFAESLPARAAKVRAELASIDGALRDCYALARAKLARESRPGGWADIVRFCERAGIKASPLRSAEARDAAKADVPTLPPEIEAAITAAAWSIAELDRRADVMAQPEIGALRTAITSALAAAREAGRRDVPS